jgi:hypothetical protein
VSTNWGVVVVARGTRRPEEGMPRASMVRNQCGVERRERDVAWVWRAVSSCVFGVLRVQRGGVGRGGSLMLGVDEAVVEKGEGGAGSEARSRRRVALAVETGSKMERALMLWA